MKQFDTQRATCRLMSNGSQDWLVNAYGLLPMHYEFFARGSINNALSHCESLNLISYDSDSASAYPHHAKRCRGLPGNHPDATTQELTATTQMPPRFKSNYPNATTSCNNHLDATRNCHCE